MVELVKKVLMNPTMLVLGTNEYNISDGSERTEDLGNTIHVSSRRMVQLKVDANYDICEVNENKEIMKNRRVKRKGKEEEEK